MQRLFQATALGMGENHHFQLVVTRLGLRLRLHRTGGKAQGQHQCQLQPGRQVAAPGRVRVAHIRPAAGASDELGISAHGGWPPGDELASRRRS